MKTTLNWERREAACHSPFSSAFFSGLRPLVSKSREPRTGSSSCLMTFLSGLFQVWTAPPRACLPHRSNSNRRRRSSKARRLRRTLWRKRRQRTTRRRRTSAWTSFTSGAWPIARLRPCTLFLTSAVSALASNQSLIRHLAQVMRTVLSWNTSRRKQFFLDCKCCVNDGWNYIVVERTSFSYVTTCTAFSTTRALKILWTSHQYWLHAFDSVGSNRVQHVTMSPCERTTDGLIGGLLLPAGGADFDPIFGNSQVLDAYNFFVKLNNVLIVAWVKTPSPD